MNGNVQLLRCLNFQDLITLGVRDVGNYTFQTYRENGYQHTPILGYCTACEEQNVHLAKNAAGFQLTNISHGAHSTDFLASLREGIDTSGWRKAPIMFVYESPSVDYDIFTDVTFKGHSKRPAKSWYWVHDDHEQIIFPDGFKGGTYGGFVLSAIITFKLENVYITNLVKCGMNNSAGQFKGIDHFQEKCVQNCYDIFLAREIEFMNPTIIFAVGSSVESKIKYLAGESRYIQQLPHPAGRRRGFRDEYYKVLYFWLITQSLHKTGIINTEEAKELAEMFVTSG